MGDEARHEEIAEKYASGEIFRLLDEVCRNAAPIEPLWGHFLFRKAITLVIGDPGVGKTTFGYSLAMNLVTGQQFLDMRAEEPIRCVYFDFESSDALVAARKSRMRENEPVPGFWVFNATDYYINDLTEHIAAHCEREGINLLIVDNQSWAFSTHDENDNAEAIRQMRYLRALANKVNASMLVFHHTSKANLSGTRKGSGAFARARLADLVINLETSEEPGYEKTHIKLSVAKNRMLDDDPIEWYLRKVDGHFEFTDAPISAFTRTNTELFTVQSELIAYMDNCREYRLKELLEAMEAKGYKDKTIRDGLKRLTTLGRLYHRYGHYRVHRSSSQQPLEPEEPF